MMKVLVDHKHQWLLWVFSLWASVVILAVACGELPQSVVREQAPTEDVQLEEVQSGEAQPEQKKAVPLSREQILIREAYKLLGAPADVVYGPYSQSIPQSLKAPDVYKEQAEADSVNKEKPEKKKKKSKNDSKKNKNKKKAKKDTQDQKPAQKVVKKQEIDYKEDNIENFGSCIVGDKPTLATIDNKLLSDLGDDVHLNLDAIKKSDIKLDGGSGSLHYEMITSKNSLRDALNLGVGGGGSSLFGLVDVKASMEYHKKSVISEESLYYVAHLEVNNPDIVMTNVKLSPKAHELYKKRGAEAFFKRCGRKAVIGFRSGGTLSAVAKYTSSGSEELEEGELVAAANAHIPGLMGVDVAGNVGLSKGKKFSGIKVSFFTAYSGGRPEEIPTTVEDLPKIAEKWGASVRKHGVIKGLITKSYKELIANINIDPDYDVIQDNIILYIEALDRLSNMRDVMLKTSKYNIVKKSLLRKTVNKQLDKLIIRLHEKLEKCRLSRKAAVCVDEELLREVDDFKPTVMVKHSSCGLEKTRITDRNPVCGKEKYNTDQWLESHPDCEVKQYTPIVVDSINVSRITEKIRGHSDDGDMWKDKYYDKARNYKFSESDYPEACQGPDVERKQEFDNGLRPLDYKYYTLRGDCIEWEEEHCIGRGGISGVGPLCGGNIFSGIRDMTLLASQGYQLISPWVSDEVRSSQGSSYIPASYSGGMSQADLYSSQQWSSESLKPGAELYQTTRSCARYEELGHYDVDLEADYRLYCTKDMPEYNSCYKKAERNKKCSFWRTDSSKPKTCEVDLESYAEELAKKKKKS